MEPIKQDEYDFTEEDLDKIEELAQLTEKEMEEIDRKVEAKKREQRSMLTMAFNPRRFNYNERFDPEEYRNRLINEKAEEKMAHTRKRYWLDVVHGGNSTLDIFSLEAMSKYLDRETFLNVIELSEKTNDLANRMRRNYFKFEGVNDFKKIRGIKEYHTTMNDNTIQLFREMIEGKDVPKPNIIVIEMKENQGVTRLSDFSNKMDDMSEGTRKTLKGMIDWNNSKFSVTLKELDEDTPEKFYFQGGQILVRTDDPRYLAMSNIDLHMYTRLTEIRSADKMFEDSIAIKGCFDGYSNLTEIVLPTSIERFDNCTFENCTALASINIPYFTSYLGAACFRKCSNLTSIKLPDYLEFIGHNCFSDCVNLRRISIPSRVSSIGYSCFQNCTNLGDVVLPTQLTKLKESCFKDCSSLSSITLVNIEVIEMECFRGCTSLVNLQIPSTVTFIGAMALPNDPYDPFHLNKKNFNRIEYERAMAEFRTFGEGKGEPVNEDEVGGFF